MSQQILDLLEGSSSQKPMPFNVLVDKSGLLPKTLTMILDSMYAQRSINQAMLTRYGVQQREVWPTGVIEKAVRMDIVINPNKTPPSGYQTRPYRRDESNFRTSLSAIPDSDIEVEKPQQPAAVESEKTMNEKPENTTPKALLILEFIEANPGCSSLEIAKAVNVQSINAYIKFHIKRGNVLIELGHSRHNKYSLKAGMTAKDIYQGGARHKPVRSTDADLRTPHADEQTKSTLNNVPTVDEKSLPIANAPVIDMDAIYKEKPAQPSQFRVAYTSDGCLIILGLQYVPIELDAAQTRELIAYVDDMKLGEVA
jgi:hypothetical protein